MFVEKSVWALTYRDKSKSDHEISPADGCKLHKPVFRALWALLFVWLHRDLGQQYQSYSSFKITVTRRQRHHIFSLKYDYQIPPLRIWIAPAQKLPSLWGGFVLCRCAVEDPHTASSFPMCSPRCPPVLKPKTRPGLQGSLGERWGQAGASGGRLQQGSPALT